MGKILMIQKEFYLNHRGSYRLRSKLEQLNEDLFYLLNAFPSSI